MSVPLLLAALLAASASAQPTSAIGCAEARWAAGALRSEAAACRRAGSAVCAVDWQVRVPLQTAGLDAPDCRLAALTLSPEALQAETLDAAAAALEAVLPARCPARCFIGTSVAGRAPERRPLGQSRTLQRLLALRGAAAGEEPRRALNGAWGEAQGAALQPAFFSPPLPSFPPPQLSVPNLTPTLPTVPTPELRPAAPPPVVAAPPAIAQPALPAAPLAGAADGNGGQGLTPCADLRNKARRLRSAADRCDEDVAGGAPACNVDVTFSRPVIPRSLPPGSARWYAGDFDRVAAIGDERACADYGGEGRVPAPPQGQSRVQALIDIFNTAANRDVQHALWDFALGGVGGAILRKITYGPDAAWTRALRNHTHLWGVRERIRDAYRTGRGSSGGWESDPYNLNNLPTAENARIFLRDILAPLVGLNMAYTTGSINFEWRQRGPYDPRTRRVAIEFRATDRLRIGSATRRPKETWSYLPDDLFGEDGPFHTVHLEWNWTEVISY